jgi:ABC-type nickel/cobalt efflux system permease component RcnA
MLTGLTTMIGIGFLLGFRHAFEPDHLAAVTTLATRQGTVKDALRLGAAWGVGHTASVGAVVVLLIVADLRLPMGVQPVADLFVAALLIGLGAMVILRHARAHRDALDLAHAQAHAHGAPHLHAPPIRDARRSFGFGIAHGLAGSGAIVVLLVATAATRAAQLAYIAAFGSGTIAGMLAVSAAVAAASRAASGRGGWAARLHLGAAAVSITVGVLLGLECLQQFR